ncbi:MAG: acyltransferase [Prevotellaceae bacterium]|jgi:surface polysaccharide O-acyltransferase-like enzyme|nr:acyltransferase [Prevotellaceae bacterium]
MVNNESSSQTIQSQVIDFMRFPMIIGVLFIHNSTSTVQIPGAEFGTEAFMPVFYYSSKLFSQVLGRIAVPLFFFMSGFLFFLNMEKFNKDSYKNKLQSRVETLLIPYLFWNFVTIAFYFVMTSIPYTASFVNGEVDIKHIFSYLWVTENGPPLAYQFWFIRDLMIAVVLTPIIYLCIKYGKIYSIIILGILWYCGLWIKISGLCTCLFFFTFGAYLGMNKRNLLEDFGKIQKLSFIFFPPIAIIDLLTKQYDFNIYIQKVDIIVGIIFCFNLVGWLIGKGKVRPVPFLSSAAFFVYAVHDPFFMIPIRKISYMLLRPATDFACTCLYFLNVISVALLTLGFYYILKLFLPKFTAIITGGR